MMDRLLQLIRLAACLIACYGYLRFWMSRFRLEPELALPVSLAALGLAMLLSAILGFALPAAAALLVLGLARAGYSLLRRESLGMLRRPGVVFFALGAALSLLLLYGSELKHGDNYSHWGAVLKMILRDDALPAHDTLVYFPAYPTGSSMLLYWFSRMSGIRAEWLWAWAQSLLQIACAAPLFCFVEGKERRERGVLTLLTAFVAVALLCTDTDPVDLLVDTLVPLLGLAGVLLFFRSREAQSRATVPLCVLAAYLPMVKNSGYFFAALLVLLALIELRGGERRRLALLLLLCVAAANRIWALHVKFAFEDGLGSYHAMSLESFGRSLAEKSADDLGVIVRAFVSEAGQADRLLWMLLALGALLLLCRGQKKLRRLCLLTGGAWLLYLVSLLGMYVFSMSAGEARHAAAFDRYYRSVVVLCAGCFWALALRALPRLEKRRLAAAGLYCALLMGFCAPEPAYLLPQSRRPDDDYLMRRRVDSAIRENHVPEGLGYVLLATPEHEGLGRVMCTYLLSPRTTVVCSDPDTLERDLYRTDYFIVVDEDSAAARAFRARFETDAAAGSNAELLYE